MKGSTSSILDGQLSAENVYEYSDFGEVEVVVSGIDNEICYTGAVYDDTTGLHYMNARYYDPSNGRFISQDSYRGSVSEPGQWHLYVYCANNPINYTDPSGYWVIAIGGKAELAGVVGIYASLATNFSKTRFAVTGSTGGKIVTNGLATVGIFAGYYPKKEISSKKASTSGISGSIGYGISLPIPILDKEFRFYKSKKKVKMVQD